MLLAVANLTRETALYLRAALSARAQIMTASSVELISSLHDQIEDQMHVVIGL